MKIILKTLRVNHTEKKWKATEVFRSANYLQNRNSGGCRK